MGKVIIMVRGKGVKTKVGQFKVVEFTDLGGGKVRNDKGQDFQMVVTRHDGGVLRGGIDPIPFRFPA